MLSKVAERVYWMSRYLERTEISARLISSHTSFLLDMPEEMEFNWFTLVEIFDADKDFEARYGEDHLDEVNIMKYMISDTQNPSSLLTALENTRENIRTLLDILPEEIWEQINQTRMQLKDELQALGSRHRRQRVLLQVVNGCQRIQGILNNHLSRDHAFDFHLVGKHLERADMNSRILEMVSLLGADNRSHTIRRYEGLLWTNMLESLGSRQMYQRTVSPRIRGEEVIPFLIKDERFPRSLIYSAKAVNSYLDRLPTPEKPSKFARNIVKRLADQDISVIPPTDIYQFMDELQVMYAELHQSIGEQWFYIDSLDQFQEQIQN